MTQPATHAAALAQLHPRRIIDSARATLAARPFLRNVSVMLTGAVLGQATSVALSPVLTRVYTPGQFGFLSVYTAIAYMLGAVTTLRYEMAIPIARDDRATANLLVVAGASVLGTSLLLALVAWALPDAWWAALSLKSIGGMRWLLPLGAAAIGVMALLTYDATRAGTFRDVARARVAQGVTGPCSQILLGLLGAGAPGLAAGFALGQIAGAGRLTRLMLRRQREHLRGVSLAGLRAVAARYRHFPLVSSWSALLEWFGAYGMFYMLIASLYSHRAAGFIFLSERVVARPLVMVSTSVLQVFLGEAGRSIAHDPAQLRRRFRQVTSRQMALGLAWVAVVNLAASWVYPRLFGPEWGAAVPFLRALSLAYVVDTVLLSVLHTLQLLERQWLSVAWQVGTLLAVLALFAGCRVAGAPALVACWGYAGVRILSCAVFFALIAAAMRRLDRSAAPA